MPIEPEPFSDESLPHRFFTLKQVAAMLATSEAQVYALVRAGDLPAIKIGGRGQWRVENRELEQLDPSAIPQDTGWRRGRI